MTGRFEFPGDQWRALEDIARRAGRLDLLRVNRDTLEDMLTCHRDAMALCASPASWPEKVRSTYARTRNRVETIDRLARLLTYFDDSKPRREPARDAVWLSLALFWRNQLGLAVTCGETSPVLDFIVEASRGIVRGSDLSRHAVRHVIRPLLGRLA